MSEADLLRMIRDKYRAMPKAERVEILSGICEADPEQKKFMKKFFPKFYEEIYSKTKRKKTNGRNRGKVLGSD
jgi:hypothetical protein